eukprot:COSAG06_NODE_59927_length_272_cov_1.265896_1_plen_45_part_10
MIQSKEKTKSPTKSSRALSLFLESCQDRRVAVWWGARKGVQEKGC